MDRVIEVVERIRRLPGGHIDTGFRQGREALLQQLNSRNSAKGLKPIDAAVADQAIVQLQQDMDELREWVRPYHLPADYQFFLEYYSGMEVNNSTCHISIRGLSGAMLHDWYMHVIGTPDYYDEGLFENGLLLVGESMLRDQRQRRIDVVLDVGGQVQQDCIIGIPQWETEAGTPDLNTVLRSPEAYRDKWTKLADSFTEWLELIAANLGSCGYP